MSDDEHFSKLPPASTLPCPPSGKPYSSSISVDPDHILSTEEREKFDALRSVPIQTLPQSSSTANDHIGTTFSADVMKRHSQLFLILRESVTAYTFTASIDSERHAYGTILSFYV